MTGPLSYYARGRTHPRRFFREVYPPPTRLNVLVASLPPPHTLPAGVGSFIVTGEAATFESPFGAAAGLFAVTGQSVAFVPSVEVGSFIVTGESASFTRAIPFVGASYAVTGEPATTTFAMPADTGGFTVTASNFLPRSTPPANVGFTSGPGAAGAPEGGMWKPRSLMELLMADSPLTLEQIRGKFPPTPPPKPDSAPNQTPFTRLTPTPNVMTVPNEEEELMELMQLI